MDPVQNSVDISRRQGEARLAKTLLTTTKNEEQELIALLLEQLEQTP